MLLVAFLVLDLFANLVVSDENIRVVNPGRHVCVKTHQIQKPVKRVESYCQPMYHKELRLCDNDGSFRLCTTFRKQIQFKGLAIYYPVLVKVVYKTAFREVFKTELATTNLYVCCPGWAQVQRTDHGCMKPLCPNGCNNGGTCSARGQCECTQEWTGKSCDLALCTRKCQNGGTCIPPNACQCTKGWTGEHCKTDKDECSLDQDIHGCQHRCMNTQGSYQCSCQTGFTLNADRKTCELCLTCVPEYNSLVGDYRNVVQRLQKLEEVKDDPKVQQRSMVDMAYKQEIETSLQNRLEEQVKAEVGSHISNLKSSLDRNMKSGIEMYIKDISLPQVKKSLYTSIKDTLESELTSQLLSYLDKQIVHNFTNFTVEFNSELKSHKLDLEIYKRSIFTYNSNVKKYREEVELYKNDLKAELHKYKTEIDSFRLSFEKLKASFNEHEEKTNSENGYFDYDRLASLSDQMALLEEKIGMCTCDNK